MSILPGVGCLILLAAAGPAAGNTGFQQVPQDAIVQTLLLIGDAGEPHEGAEPVLRALGRDLAARPERTTVVFLGDNLYPAGLPPEGSPHRAEMERRLDDQVDAVRDRGARIVFVPGNHDWDDAGADGWNAVRRQEERVRVRGGSDVLFLPRAGCQGPEILDIGEHLRLIALDTQWWLHEHERPIGPNSACAADSAGEVVAALRQAVKAPPGRDVVVVSHHPPISGGPHGGKFSLRQHVFPLTDRVKWLWLPLPVIGSIYPIARSIGATAQDISSKAYQHMREAIESAWRDRPPLAWAAGHEHILQVIESKVHGRVLVSGAGVYSHTSHVGKVEGSRYQSSRSGYMRIDFLADGRRLLSVIEVDADGLGRQAWMKSIDSSPGQPLVND